MSISLYGPDDKFLGVIILDRDTEAQTQAEIRRIEYSRGFSRGEIIQKRRGLTPEEFISEVLDG